MPTIFALNIYSIVLKTQRAHDLLQTYRQYRVNFTARQDRTTSFSCTATNSYFISGECVILLSANGVPYSASNDVCSDPARVRYKLCWNQKEMKNSEFVHLSVCVCVVCSKIGITENKHFLGGPGHSVKRSGGTSLK